MYIDGYYIINIDVPNILTSMYKYIQSNNLLNCMLLVIIQV